MVAYQKWQLSGMRGVAFDDVVIGTKGNFDGNSQNSSYRHWNGIGWIRCGNFHDSGSGNGSDIITMVINELDTNKPRPSAL